jgi:2-desacetyl-2-hydroxyethyl bacteriochlorophyllide A dehydrogenase
MKLLQIMAPGEVEWRDAPTPEPGPGEVLLEVRTVNTCPHWDLHLMDGVPMFPGAKLDYPYTPGQPGHEAAGVIKAVGPGVEHLAPGRRVACWKDAGHNRQGCYAQYVVMAAEHVLPLPDHVTWEQACSLELAMCVHVSFEQLMRFGPLEGKRVGVGGLGAAGIVAVQIARALGAAEVVGVDPLPERRDLARQVGATRVVDPARKDDWPAGRRNATAVDVAVDCTGLKASIEFLMDRARQAVAIFGVLREEITYGPNHRKELALLGYESHRRSAAGAALALIAAGKLDLSPLIGARLPFTEYLRGVEMLRRKEAIKVCFLPWGE